MTSPIYRQNYRFKILHTSHRLLLLRDIITSDLAKSSDVDANDKHVFVSQSFPNTTIFHTQSLAKTAKSLAACQSTNQFGKYQQNHKKSFRKQRQSI